MDIRIELIKQVDRLADSIDCREWVDSLLTVETITVILNLVMDVDLMTAKLNEGRKDVNNNSGSTHLNNSSK